MKILVTGANGFLGQYVVKALLGGEHEVRVLIRPATRLDHIDWAESVEIARADLRAVANLDEALRGVDAVIHLAAAMSGDDFACFSETVIGTENLFEAMRRADVKRLVLCSSFSVYDWMRASGALDERSAVLRGEDVYKRGGYAAAKLWQERLAERQRAELGWDVTIIRPGFIWGAGNECPEGSIGASLGPLHFVFCAGRQLPFTHVVNAADCFRAAIENPKSIGETLNLVDENAPSAWRFMGEYLQRRGGGVRIWLPYWFLWPSIRMIFYVARLVLGTRIKLPYLFMPAGFAQGYRPLHFSTRKVVEVLNWHPPLNTQETFEETFRAA